MAKLSPVFNDQTIDANGDPAVGYKLFTYAAGSSTKQTVYTDAAGTVPQSNPIILDSLGFPTQGSIWIPEGISIKFVLALPTDTDPPASPIKTIDNVQGVNDASVSVSEWQPSGVAPAYISTVSFSLLGDQTTEFQKGRRAQFTTSGGTKYGKIINSVFTTLTTVTMLMDGTDVLDGGLSVVNLSLLHSTPSALPNPIELLRSAVVGHATLTPTWDYAYGEVQDVSGVITYTAIPNAPRPGAYRIWYPAAGATMTNGGNISVQGGASVTAAAGDKWIINAATTTTFDVQVVRKDGLPTTPVTPVAVRSAVLSGASNRIAAGTGLSANLNATTVPVRLAFANGFGSNGQIDYVAILSANVAAFWPTLTASTTNYLFFLRNAATGVVTGVSYLLPYISQDSSVAPSIVNGQVTELYDVGQFYVGNGAAAVATQLIPAGQAVTSGAAVTSVLIYGLNRIYVSPAQTITYGGLITLPHGLGSRPSDLFVSLTNVTPEGGYTAGQVLAFPIHGGYDGAAVRGFAISPDAINVGIRMSTNTFQAIRFDTGAPFAITAGSWTFSIKAKV